MSEIIDSLNEKINIDKDFIKVAPRKGIKAIQSLKNSVDTMKKSYEEINRNLLDEIEKRYRQLSETRMNPEIERKNEELTELVFRLSIVDDRDVFEKIQFDKTTYNINGYYKKDLDTINNEIMEGITELEDIGISVSAKDFDISEYAYEYMDVLLEEAKKGNVNSDRVKEIFDKIYWKCSEFVSHIYVCIRQIFDNNEEEIKGYYSDRIEKILSSLRSTVEKMESKKNELIREKEELEVVDDKLILDNFLSGVFNINDFKKDFYESNYEELVAKDFSEFTQTDIVKMNENIKKLYDNLVEYSKFLQYKFLCDDILKIREDELKKREEKKNTKVKITEYEAVKKEITKQMEEIKRINNNISKPKKHGLFGKAHKTDESTELLNRTNAIQEVKKLYLKLDDIRIRDMVVKKITQTSSLLDVLKLASNYYGFMAKSIININNEITDTEIEKMIEDIRKYVALTNFTVINNVNAFESKELAIIIKDKYKLYGMNLTKENFMPDNVDDLIKKVKNIYDYNNIQKSDWLIEEIDYVIKAKELLKK